MMPSVPKITKLVMRKASGEIELISPLNGQIQHIVNEQKIRYEVDDEYAGDTLKISLACDIHTTDIEESDVSGQLKAIVEIIYQVTLSSKFETDCLDEIMGAVWPYLRAGAVHQLQLIDLDMAETIPYVL